MSEITGVIYILTNPSFPEYVKIGYTDDIETRLQQLNRTECTPFAFRVYATYEVTSRLSDMKVHQLIDQLNPDLRSIDTVDGKERRREFFAMTPEDAYSILDAMAEIHGCKDRLRLHTMSEQERKDVETAKEIENEHREKAPNFTFSMCKIPIGDYIEFHNDPVLRFEVVSDNRVLYNGMDYSLSALARELTGSKYNLGGPRFFKYHGEWLNDLRKRYESNERLG